MRSGTSGFAMTAPRGSGRGTSGTDTSPAPSRLRADEAADAPELRTETERAEDSPVRESDSRPETERRDDDEREEARELPRADEESRPPPPAIPVAGDDTMPVGDTTGASPQVSQYSSPPPMSS
ncbi:hypothetical protein GCM10010271_19710 [Streptomyces kurssanovii]|nr:hypothetical protein GCM10010271_19710 [Streptomyces kurssanovii]